MISSVRMCLAFHVFFVCFVKLSLLNCVGPVGGVGHVPGVVKEFAWVEWELVLKICVILVSCVCVKKFVVGQ